MERSDGDPVRRDDPGSVRAAAGRRSQRAGACRPGPIRHSLQKKLVLWTILLVTVPTWVCSTWFNQYARTVLDQSHAQNAAMLGQTIAGALAGQFRAGPSAISSTLNALQLDSRVAFVIVVGQHGGTVHRHIPDALAWAAYTQWETIPDQWGFIELDRPVFLGPKRDLVMRKVPILDPPPRATDATDGRAPPNRQLLGYIVLAVRDRELPAALERLWAMQVICACVVCILCVPVVVWAVRKWVWPLRSLLVATQRLAAGQRAQPVRVGSTDELAALADSFNQMAARLWDAQRDLQIANEDLERKVATRTAELEHAKSRLEAEIRDKNEFLRAVSHDLGAPLRNISGLAAMLLMKYRGDLADDAINKIERIRANVGTQVDLINDLLELSRLRTRPGKQEEVDLHALVLQLRDSLSYDLEQSRITLEIPVRLPTVIGDANRLRQVFQNLLDNAVKYMLDSSQRRVTVRYLREDRVLHFVVSDTGRGIAPAEQPYVFDVFRRASNTGRVPGRGVGLAGVKSIVEGYGGRVWVESQLDRGSDFHFTLDRAMLVEPTAAAGTT